jgi:hypothetical protein
MNDKIKQLAVQSGMSKLVDSWEYERFAELIVRECQDFVGDKGSMAVKEMLEHFGVEE